MVNYFSSQPALNYGYYKVEKSWQQPVDAPGPLATLAAMEDVMRFWLKMGCDGFRVDMADSLVKNDPEGKGTIALWQKVRDFLDREYPNAVLVSEWGDPDKSLEGGFHMDFLLHFGPSHYNDLFRCENPWFSSEGKGDISRFVNRYEENGCKNRNRGLICIPSGNHDMCRLAKHLHGEELKLAFAFLLSMPGIPGEAFHSSGCLRRPSHRAGAKKGQGFSVSSGEEADCHPAGPSGPAEQGDHFLCPRAEERVSPGLPSRGRGGNDSGNFESVVPNRLFSLEREAGEETVWPGRRGAV